MRLRAQVLRLSGGGESIKRISAYIGRSEASISRDLDRLEDRRFEGLANSSAPAVRRLSPRRQRSSSRPHRGSVEKAQELLDARALLWFVGGVEASSAERPASVRSRGASMLDRM